MKNLALIFLLSSLAVSASAQITLRDSDFINFETSQVNGVTDSALNPNALSAISGESGMNQTWDFTQASYKPQAQSGTLTILPYATSSGIPDASDPDFSSATNVEKYVSENPPEPPVYVFYEINSSGSWYLGESTDSAGTPIKIEGLNPGEQIFAFPLMYQSTWESTSNVDHPYSTTDYVDSVTIKAVVDGYGTVIIPGHTEPALRVKQTLIATSGFPGNELVDTNLEYDFYTQDGYSAMIYPSSDGTVVYATYTVPPNSSTNAVRTPPTSTDALDLTLTQNPASNAGTRVIYTLSNDGPVQVKLMDELGRNVRMLQNGTASAGQNRITIDTKSLVQGTYFVRVESDGKSAMQKLVIQ